MRRLNLFAWAALAPLAIAPIASAQSSSNPIRMMFSDTSVSTVLKAIATRTGANIVYAGKEKSEVTLNVTVSSVDQAVQTAASAAGMSYRKVGNVYVVSTADNMRTALEPYTQRMKFPLGLGIAERYVPTMKEAFPHASFSAFGGELMVRALPEDMGEIRSFVDKMTSLENQTQITTEIVPVGSASSEEITKLVQSLHPNVKVNFVKGDNMVPSAVALVGPRNEVVASRTVVDRLAKERPVDMPSTSVYEIKYSNAAYLMDFMKKAMPDIEVIIGPEQYSPPRAAFKPINADASATVNSGSGSGSGGGGGAGGGSGAGAGGGQGNEQDLESRSGNLNDPHREVKYGDRAKRIIIRGLASRVKEAEGLLAQVDMKPKQVMVEVNVVETQPSFSEQLGLDYSWTPLRFFETPAGSIFQGVAGKDLSDFQSKPVGLGQWSRTPWSIEAMLKAQTTRGTAKLLANPKVQVIDNDSANIFIGDTLRVALPVSGALGSQTVELREFPVGITLLILPRVNADGNITMHVNPVISSITSVGSNGLPQTSSREAETTVMVKSGETIVLGGLIRDEEIRSVTEIPLLSKLPIVGELFKSRNNSKKRTDVIVTITPRIVEDGTKEAQPK